MQFSSEVRAYSDLTESVVAATRRATVKSFQDLGIQVSSWQDILQLDNLDHQQMADHMIGNIRYTEADVTLPRPLLGAVQIVIRNSRTPLPYMFNNAFSDMPYGDFLINTIDTPLKHVEIQLGKTAKLAIGRLFITPDSPPAAVHDEDVQFVIDKNEYALEYDDTRIPAYVIGAFGNQNVQYLTAAQCNAITDKIMTSSVITMRFDD